jgi:hypothetical protein
MKKPDSVRLFTWNFQPTQIRRSVFTLLPPA